MADTSFAKSVLEELREFKREMAQPVADTSAVTGVNGRGVPTGAPNVRRGESPYADRPFSLIRALGWLGGVLRDEDAKIEADTLTAFNAEAANVYGRRVGREMLLPMDGRGLPYDLLYSKAGQELHRSMLGGASNLDYDRAAFISQKLNGWGSDSIQRAPLSGAQSYLDDSLMGSLVHPPQFLGIIPIMRNKLAVANAGASTVTIPQQGRAVFSKQSSTTTAYWPGPENATITTSTVGTGQVMMESKKVAVGNIVPNDLFKFAGPEADSMLTNDMALTLALTIDYNALYGPGNGRIRGLFQYTGTNEVVFYENQTDPTPISVGVNGNSLAPQDGENMIGYIEDRNFDADEGWAWIMRGSRWRSTAAKRADAVTPGDQAGPFVFSITRDPNTGAATGWDGYKVVRSSQVDASGTKGSGTNLTQCIGGIWPGCMVGMYGAMEFARTPGENAFLADQTIIRGIAYADVVFKYPGSFVVYRNLIKRG